MKRIIAKLKLFEQINEININDFYRENIDVLDEIRHWMIDEGEEIELVA